MTSPLHHRNILNTAEEDPLMDTTHTNNSDSTPKHRNSTTEHHVVTILHDNRNKDLMTVREQYDSGEDAKRSEQSGRMDITIQRAASSGTNEYDGTLQTPGQPTSAVVTKKTQPLVSDRPSTKYSMEQIFGSSNGGDLAPIKGHIESGALEVKVEPNQSLFAPSTEEEAKGRSMLHRYLVAEAKAERQYRGKEMVGKELLQLVQQTTANSRAPKGHKKSLQSLVKKPVKKKEPKVTELQSKLSMLSTRQLANLIRIHQEQTRHD